MPVAVLFTFLIPAVCTGQAAIAAQAPATAQAPAAAQAPAGPAKPGQPAVIAGPLESPGFSYNPEGRRDPFINLLRRGSDAKGSATSRTAGIGGLGVSEVTLKGTVASREGFVAILQGSDEKTYIVRPGEHLLDGTIRSITANAVVMLQQVNDPLSLEKQREVRKVLRQMEEAK
jgi:Tfp pilus assembly protein PilP